MATLHLDKVSKSFGSTKVIHDISLAVEDKEFVVFVGPSGCGKSTLLRMIAGLEEASSGKVIIDGEDVSDAHPVDRGISMVFQSYALYPHLTVYENIAFPLRVQKASEADIQETVKKAAEILQLSDKLQLKPGQLSGGQRQRVAIGRSIVRDPKIFLFDEPLSNLDAALRGDMRIELRQLHNQLGATMIYVTHDQVEAMTMADRIVVLNGGQIEQYGSPLELYHHPKTKFVAGFIGQPNMNFLSGIVADVKNDLLIKLFNGRSLKLPVDKSTLSVGEAVDIGVRPEDLRVANKGTNADVTVSVKTLERLGGVSIVYGSHNAGDGQRFCASLDGCAAIKEGENIGLNIEPTLCHVFNSKGQALRRLRVPDVLL